MTFIGEVPQSILLGEAGEKNNNVKIIENEVAAEIGKTKEGLDVFDFLRFQPIGDHFNFVRGHCQSMLPELVEYFLDMLFVRGHILGVDEDVIQIDYDTNIEHISKDGIDELLKSCQSIGQTKQHYKPLIGGIMGVEGSLPFISGCDSDEMVGMLEVNLCIYFTAAWRVEEVGDEQKWIVVFLHDFVEFLEVDTKAEGAVLLADKEDWSSMSKRGWMDETISKVFIKENMKGV
ncbi:hypothetical protein PAXRUDRAFT_170434 [Paxillus rubicundulus Ve08.2h10]|uniref:Uncharacterized protein n=1 Tax=Paxillus rubicundulus Ve08.2h10 TaxID=930991 RepID=A0A0D0CYF4_9AGAM|nr:hypothetical protein PAXRUDRAFT_170434 [Paxillus rubicundulus Ve08.2h10]